MNGVRRMAGMMVVSLTLGSCSPSAVSFPFNIVSSSCSTPGPLDQATHIELLVTGPGIAQGQLKVVRTVTEHSAMLPQIPVGPHRVLEVRAYAGDPTTGGQVLSVGRSPPFDVPLLVPTGPPPAPVTVVLRRVNSFVPVGLGANCQVMLSARAAHSATLLSDGRVFIAGGFSLGTGATQMLSSTELFDPTSETFSAGPDMGPAEVRAYHTATALPTGQVLLAGGEAVQAAATLVHQDALVFDPATNAFSGVALLQARSRHGAAEAGDGGVLLVGGFSADGGLADQLEWFDPGSSVIQPAGITLALSGAAVAPARDGTGVLVVGGTDGGAVSADALFFSFTGSGFVLSTSAPLLQARQSAAIAPFPDSGTLTVFGGYPDPVVTNTTLAIGSSELISGNGSGLVSIGGPVVVPRAQLCAVVLSQGQVLTAGGTTVNTGAVGPGVITTDPSAELIRVSPAGLPTALGMPPLPAGGRYLHTCTPLPDGSALILGGQDLTTGQVLQDAFIFMPSPQS